MPNFPFKCTSRWAVFGYWGHLVSNTGKPVFVFIGPPGGVLLNEYYDLKHVSRKPVPSYLSLIHNDKNVHFTFPGSINLHRFQYFYRLLSFPSCWTYGLFQVAILVFRPFLT
jgi:hypothetical protein